jgi:hypothetical protein
MLPATTGVTDNDNVATIVIAVRRRRRGLNIVAIYPSRRPISRDRPDQFRSGLRSPQIQEIVLYVADADTSSRWSIRSQGSVLSVGSRGSVLSIGSVGSALSIGSIGSFGSVLSVGSFCSIGSALSGASVLAIMSWRAVRSVLNAGAGLDTLSE